MCLIWKFVIYHSRTCYLVSNLWCHKWFPYRNLIWVWLIKGIAIFCLGLNGYISIHVLPDEWIQKTHPILGNQPPNPSNLHHVIDIAPSKISRFVHVLLNGTSAPLRYQWHPTKPGRFPPPAREDVSDLWEPLKGMLFWIGSAASKVAEGIFLPKVCKERSLITWASYFSLRWSRYFLQCSYVL